MYHSYLSVLQDMLILQKATDIGHPVSREFVQITRPKACPLRFSGVIGRGDETLIVVQIPILTASMKPGGPAINGFA